MKKTGAQIICESLIAEGVDVMFGFPGGALLPFYDTLPQYPQIRHILVRHEQAAAHAADGYARVTGKVGVCMATSGPGATNLVTGIANAYMDSVPIVAITGQVNTSVIGRDAFQEIDITGITLPITKHSYLVTDVSQLARIIKEAFHIAATGRPGPVLIDLPIDVQPKLLRFLEQGEIMPLGETRPLQVDVRVIAATNADLEQPVGDGRVNPAGPAQLGQEKLLRPGQPAAEAPVVSPGSCGRDQQARVGDGLEQELQPPPALPVPGRLCPRRAVGRVLAWRHPLGVARWPGLRQAEGPTGWAGRPGADLIP